MSIPPATIAGYLDQWLVACGFVYHGFIRVWPLVAVDDPSGLGCTRLVEKLTNAMASKVV